MDAMTGQRRNGPASCRLRKPHSLPVELRANVRELVKLHTHAPSRNQGYASELLADLGKEADESGIALMVSVDGEEWLSEWYARHGFDTVQREPVHVMVRVPHG